MDVLAVIPARGGSKRIPGKNMATFGGRPLIEWTIRAARRSNQITRLVVSSDDPAILSFARQFPGVVALRRDPALARDASPIDALERQLVDDLRPETYVRLQPTSPLRESFDIDAAVGLISDGAQVVVSCCEVREHPYLIKSAGWQDIVRGADVNRLGPAQAYEPYYWINGAIYAARREHVGKWYDADLVTPYVMPRARSIDIDDYADLVLGEAMLGRV